MEQPAPGDRQRPRVTLATIARQTGVSLPTVSKVLNGRSGVASSTRRRVLEALSEAGYPHRPVGSESGSVFVDVLMPDYQSMFTSMMVRGMEERARQMGLTLVLTTVGHPMQRSRSWLRRVASHESRGVIATLMDFAPHELDWLRDNRVPHVLVEPLTPPADVTPWLTSDSRGGVASAVRHLAMLGHTDIAYLNNLTIWSGSERFAGYATAMATAGLRLRDDYIHHVALDGGMPAALERLLALPDPPSAVITSSDQLALELIATAAARGLRVPEELSVIGFDDVPEAERSSPTLTTVHQPVINLGVDALTLVLDGAGVDDGRDYPFVAKTSLVVRDSVTLRPAIAGGQ
ncbi:LacI family DNA-binding transcriptional regulator [Phytoactinopolyspora endophytica]|uniref:LacI family DNA-binding transcriptional regulator n=1 Tax=Phytoactinopolyspora endophytica TaxID=1642495 RepID=UPI00101BBD69|nr:LacI family DNA-binding transcriptional regulator [Phytoactinopolyspora endophytica]